MSPFYKLLIVVLIAGVLVIAYDLFQAEIEKGEGDPRIRFDPATGRFTFWKPDIRVRIVFASMFGPGEPVMRVRDEWIYMFEEDYSDLLAKKLGREVTGDEKIRFVRETLKQAAEVLGDLSKRLEAIESISDASEKTQQTEELLSWLEDRHVFLTPLEPMAGSEQTLRALRDLITGLDKLAKDADAARLVRVAPRLVSVERRWQGRWVLSANRPRFLTGREVPDVITGSKMELLALVQDHYAVPLNVPLAGEKLSPLDAPDTYGDPGRAWREAFLPKMLKEGKYDFLDDPTVKGKIYLAPLTCSTTILFYNEVLFARAGIDGPPRTWPEFIAVCEKLKAAGITPLTADADVYSDYWQSWLIFRAMGPETWERTISGVPPGKPPAQRRSDPPWTDPRYQQVHAEIRRLRDSGYFDKDFPGSTWPAAQRGFAKGSKGPKGSKDSAAMMICGSWLVQELSGYKGSAAAKRFRLKCFSFPQWPGGHPRDQTAAWAVPYGLMVCRQGKAIAHAIELVKYLSAKDWPDMVHKNAQISCMADADFPPDLAGIEQDFRNASTVYSRTPNIYAPRFGSQVLSPRYRAFFLQERGTGGYVSVEQFLEDMDEQNRRYLSNGGEEGYE